MMRSQRELIIFLGLLMAAPAFCTDAPAPALPAVGAAFDAPATTTQLTLSLFMLGYGLGNLIYGPLSDRWGRRAAMLLGLSLFALSSLVCVLAPTIGALIAARFCQGLGACVGPVMARAVVRDRFNGREAATALSAVTFIFGLAPVLSPLVGAGGLMLWDWRAVFAFLGLYALVTLVMALWRYRDPAPPLGGVFSPLAFLDAFRAVLRHPQARAGLAGLCAAYAGMLFYVGGAARVMINVIGLSTGTFSLFFAFSGAFLAAGAVINGYLTRRYDPDVLLRRAIVLAFGSGLAMLTATLLFPLSPWAVALPMCGYSFATGLINPNGMARILAPFPKTAGATSAVLGAAQVCCGALSVYLAGLAYHGGGAALGGGLSLFAGLSCLILLRRR